MADPVQIQNKEEIAEEIGSNLGGSLKKIFEKMTAEQQRIASVQKILNLEEKREKAVRDKELLEAIRGIKLNVNALEKKDSMGFLELLGLGGLFGLLSSITAVVGGVTLGLTTEGALFNPKTFGAAVDNFKLKFPDFTSKVKNFFGVADNLPTIPDTPKPPDASIFDNFKSKVSNLVNVTTPSIINDTATKIDEVGDAARVSAGAVDTTTLAGKLTGTAGKITASVAGRVLSIAGNPVFDAIAMGKDIFDIGSAKFDDDVKTAVKKEDIGAVVGGFIGGAIGAIGGPAGVALGVGLGNMAGEFVGTLIDQPEIVSTIENVKTELNTEKENLTTDIADLEAKIKDNSFSKEMKDLFQKQLDASKNRLTSVNSELDSLKTLDKTQEELKEIDKQAQAAVQLKEKLELQLEDAKSRNDAAAIKFLNQQIDSAEATFKQAEIDYAAKSEELRDKAQETSAKLAEASTSFFDRMASEGGFIGGIFSLFGGEALEGDALQNLKTANKNELEARKAELEAKIADDSIMSVLFRSRYKKELRDIEGELKTAHTGGRITETGAIVAQKGEVIIDDILVGGLQQAINFLSQSAVMMRENGSPVVVNNINNSQSNPVISNQATTVKVPDAVRSGEPSFGMAARAMMN